MLFWPKAACPLEASCKLKGARSPARLELAVLQPDPPSRAYRARSLPKPLPQCSAERSCQPLTLSYLLPLTFSYLLRLTFCLRQSHRQVVEQWLTVRNVRPLRILISGPPMSGNPRVWDACFCGTLRSFYFSPCASTYGPSAPWDTMTPVSVICWEVAQMCQVMGSLVLWRHRLGLQPRVACLSNHTIPNLHATIALHITADRQVNNSNPPSWVVPYKAHIRQRSPRRKGQAASRPRQGQWHWWRASDMWCDAWANAFWAKCDLWVSCMVALPAFCSAFTLDGPALQRCVDKERRPSKRCGQVLPGDMECPPPP